MGSMTKRSDTKKYCKDDLNNTDTYCERAVSISFVSFSVISTSSSFSLISSEVFLEVSNVLMRVSSSSMSPEGSHSIHRMVDSSSSVRGDNKVKQRHFDRRIEYVNVDH